MSYNEYVEVDSIAKQNAALGKHVHEHEKLTPEQGKAKAQRIAAAAQQAKQAAVSELNADVKRCVDAFQLKFIDIPQYKGCAGSTIAYSGDSVLRVATALRNPKDRADKLVGRHTAALAFACGHCIYLRCPKGVQPAYFLRAMFGYEYAFAKRE